MERLRRRQGFVSAAELASYDRMVMAVDAELGAGASGRSYGNDALRAFKERFGAFTAEQGYALVAKHATWKSRGPVFNATDVLVDDRGDTYEFVFESFCNTHTLLTIGAVAQRRPAMATVI
jgi:hypothetical protein